MSDRLFSWFCRKHDPDRKRITLLKSNDDPGLGAYLDWQNSKGSTCLEIDGIITVKIHDRGGATKAVWLEELAHVLQILRDGSFCLSRDQADTRRNELEVHECLIDRVKKR